MTNDVLISANGVGKKFCKNLKRSLWYGAKDLIVTVAGSDRSEDLRKDEFWAVQDINFEVKRGECLGLIGHNGAGKSTLLKMLNGLIRPDKGTITMRGRVGALIELGAGFNPILTGRENIFNNAAILGFTKKETLAKMDDIIAFSEIEDFLDMPVQNYSSGMRVRLGFAIAAQMEPDILLIDEVLAVGDVGFRIKCMNRIQELLKQSAVIFVSHAMTQVSFVSNGIMLMDHGKVDYLGTDVGLGVEKYFSKFSNDQQQVLKTKQINLDQVVLSTLDNNLADGILQMSSGEPLFVSLCFSASTEIKRVRVRIGIVNMEYRLVAEVDSFQTDTAYKNLDGTITTKAEINNLHLRFGRYTMQIIITDVDTNEIVLRQTNMATFVVKETMTVGADFLLPVKWMDS